MSALEDLQQMIAAQPDALGEAEKLPSDWVFNQIEADNARKAAVLLLFGSATDQELQATSSPADLDLLFVERATTLRKHAGQVAFPGGGIDPEDDSVAAAALREAWEETGVNTSGIKILGQLAETELPVSNFLVTPVIGWWHTESEVYPVDLQESSDVFRAPVSQLLNPENRVTGVVRRGNRRYKSPAFEYQGHLIWGFTAIVIDRLFNELGWTRQWNPARELQMN